MSIHNTVHRLGDCPRPARSDVADFDGPGKRREGVARRYELVGDVAGEAGLHDGPHDRGIVQLLGLVDFVSARLAAGVGVAYQVIVSLDRADQTVLLCSNCKRE